jgi:ribonuclease PH
LALADAIKSIPAEDALVGFVSSVSVGIYKGTPVLDLDYAEDSNAETDMNVVRLGDGFIELQGTGEAAPFTKAELASLIDLAEQGTEQLLALQQAALQEG